VTMREWPMPWYMVPVVLVSPPVKSVAPRIGLEFAHGNRQLKSSSLFAGVPSCLSHTKHGRPKA
jgi:hypothetical protein